MTYHKKMYTQDTSYSTDPSTHVNLNHQSLKQVRSPSFFNPYSKAHKYFCLRDWAGNGHPLGKIWWIQRETLS